MCGRYAMGIRAAFVRYQFTQHGMQVDHAPPDEEVRETYNFPPGAYGLVYRAVVPDTGFGNSDEPPAYNADGEPTEPSNDILASTQTSDKAQSFEYELKPMKWGLIPFWTKRSPDYGSMLRTINCRDDSLLENRGMWNTMKQRKRCVVVAQGFYEWLKKGPGGKEKVPHFVKRKDGNLMCFAGLWDCVRYEDAEEKLYSYTIITTDSNKQLNFLHDRMPVILDSNSEAMKTWLDPTRNKWTKELQSLLQPYDGQLDCYPVNKDVGKVGNNSPDFILPVDSKENKKNIANFFGNAAKKAEETKVEHEEEETRQTKDHNGSENQAPLPVPDTHSQDLKRKGEYYNQDVGNKMRKVEPSNVKPSSPTKVINTKAVRSAVTNEGNTMKVSPAKKTPGSTQRITDFFAK